MTIEQVRIEDADGRMRFSIAAEIAAPAGRVFEVMSDTDRWHEWTPSVSRIKRLDKGGFAVGSRLKIWQPAFPPAVWKLTVIEADRSFTWVSGLPGLRVVARHSIEGRGAGSRATLSVELRGFLGRWFGRKTQDVTRRYLEFEAAGLKARSENPAFMHDGASLTTKAGGSRK